MAKHLLTDMFVKNATEAGLHADGACLYLRVDPKGNKRWVFIYRIGVKRSEMGLGVYPKVSLRAARTEAVALDALKDKGIDPLTSRREAKSAKRTMAESASKVKAKPTFWNVAVVLMDHLAEEWKNPKHRQQWRNTLIDYAGSIKDKPVDEITSADVIGILRPIWHTKRETASRVRGRIERVLDSAMAENLREEGKNPAALTPIMRAALGNRTKRKVRHHPAMPYDDVPAFLSRLREVGSISARALEFTILTAARSGETLGATWAEVDLKAKLWTVPEGRMKAEREHRVPLSGRAVEILEEVGLLPGSDDPDAYVFPGSRQGRPLSTMAMEMQLRRLKVTDATPHGFRSSFRDWAGETTAYPRDVVEFALAHVVKDETEAAYRRGDALEKRRALMKDWATFIEPKDPGVVVDIAAARKA
ncbi:tyrosine-type recombinase/integrase [Microvirga antarctica]|uniref:tyrosine-type recombinase/integrase n=1 Tax=Microvirga antarctica TaxID=2819233 RepID=UPI001B30D2CC|nr:site-specific integrase [Microvirga antarctica]